MGRAVFLFIVIVIGMIFGVNIFWHLLGWMTVLAWGVTAVVFVVGMLYCLWLLMKASGGGGPKFKMPKGKPQYKVWNTKSSTVYIFREQPTLKDLAMLTDELHLAKLELQGDVFAVDNDTRVIVLEDDGKESVKVKFKHAKKKDRDAVGWVCRSSLIKEEKLIG